MEQTIQRFLAFGERYGFRIEEKNGTYTLCARNTDGRLCQWIRFNPARESILYTGNTDHLNIWLHETRKDFTAEKCLQFIKELNEVFELDNDNQFRMMDLIDPEDWQEIAQVQDAYSDPRYLTGKLPALDSQIAGRESTSSDQRAFKAPEEPCR